MGGVGGWVVAGGEGVGGGSASGVYLGDSDPATRKGALPWAFRPGAARRAPGPAASFETGFEEPAFENFKFRDDSDGPGEERRRDRLGTAALGNDTDGGIRRPSHRSSDGLGGENEPFKLRAARVCRGPIQTVRPPGLPTRTTAAKKNCPAAEPEVPVT